jgi:hypothetical protein
LTCRHLLHLRKKKKDDDEPPSLLPFSTLEEEKKQRDDDEREGSSSSATLMEKKTRVKKKQRKKKVDVHLLATFALVIFWRSVFCNTTLATSSITSLQHRSCNIASTPPLQHCLLQQHFNIASLAPSFAASLLLLSGSKV